MRSKARSSERKPACCSGASASTAAATVTSGRSWPLATIWVPRRMAAPGRANSPSRRRTAPRPEALEPSIRTRRAAGTSRASAASSPCEPEPWRATPAAPHDGHTPGTGRVRPQWWQTSRRGASCCTRATSQPGQRAIHPHSRQSAISANPRRLASSTAFSPRDAAACRAEASGFDTGPGALQAHVDDLDRGRGRAVGPRPQRPPRQRVPGLRARGRGAVDDGRAGGAARRAATWRAS